jgi:hemicentin
LDDESEDHLEIDSLEISHDGKYKCLAKNKYGSAKIDFQISMYEPAKILTALEEQKSFQSGNSLHLSCASRGNPLPVISWTLNGHVMTTTSKLNVDKLFKASQQDNVIYFDGFGNGITYLDPFEVKLSKQKFYSQLTRVDAKTLKLDMIFKDREKLKNKKFTCYGFNALGRDEKSVEVTVNRKPYVKERNKKITDEIEILEHLPLLLTCLIDGEPEPKITWYKNGHQVYENETLKFLNDKKFLSIPEAFSWNSGNYSCVGKNSEGELEIKFYVTILAPPKFSDYTIKTIDSRFYNDRAKIVKSNENEEVINVIKGEDVILECWTEASPKPKIHWVKLNLIDGKKNEILKENGNVMVNN